MKISGRKIYFRLVTLDDAEFIVSLRNDKKNKFLIEVDLQDQLRWLAGYKLREQKGLEYYFIICTNCNEPCGTVRIYDFKNDSFCWGSWLLNSNAPSVAGIESALLVYEYAFYNLGFNHCHFDVKIVNSKVRAFHERFGATVVTCDTQNVYYELTLSSYESAKEKYVRYLPEQVIYEN